MAIDNYEKSFQSLRVIIPLNEEDACLVEEFSVGLNLILATCWLNYVPIRPLITIVI